VLSGRIDRVAVVVPAHNEQESLPGCLDALRRAAAAVAVPVELVVVPDACTDGTEALLQHAAVDAVVPVHAGNVGVARAAGTAVAVQRTGPDGLWLLSTDADTLVPRDWIARHLAHAARGAEVVVGTVRPLNWHGWPPGLARRYRTRYAGRVDRRGHGHVHGANLGLRAHAYLALGGFAALATGEDVALVRAARRRGLTVTAALDLAVRTSTRARARAPLGFSAHLHELATDGGTQGGGTR
jgi:glycosyltransferase involved in cell wall biosynthesis